MAFTWLSGFSVDGKVGIGTTTPSGLLHLSSTSPSIYIEDTDATNTYNITTISGGNNLTFDTRRSSDGAFVSTDYQIVKDALGANYHRWFTQGSERMRIDSSGNVGIGETNPTAKLHLSTTGSEPINLGIQNSERYYKIETDGGYLTFNDVSAGGTARMVIDSSGKVGIGTITPGSVLHVSGGSTTIPTLSGSHPFTISNTNNSGMSIISGTDDNGQVVFGDGSDADVGRLRYQHSDNSMRFWTNAAEKMRIASDGAIKFNTYGAGTLVSDASGNITAEGGTWNGPFLPLAGGTMTAGAVVTFLDSSGSTDDRLKFGSGGDMQLFHDGTASHIVSSGSDLRIDAPNFIVRSASGTESIIRAAQNAAVELYYDNSKKFETTDLGVTFSNLAATSAASSSVDEVKIGSFGAGRPAIYFGTSDTTYSNSTWFIENIGASGKFRIGRNGLDVFEILNSGDTTFAGNVSIVGTSAQNYRVTDGTQNIYVGSSANARFGLGAGSSIIQSTGAAFGIGTQDGQALRFGTNNTEVLTLDTSSNATFAGAIGIGGITPANGYMVDIAPTGGNIIRSTRGTSVFGAYQSNNSDVYLGTISNDTFKIITNDGTAITIGANNDANFAGNTSALTVTSRDNMFVDAGQLYIGADDSQTDNTYRQVVNTGAGSFKLQKRISGTFTDVLGFDNLQNATFGTQAFATTATSTGNASSTLTTKGYVDGLITGATIYRGTWQAGISATSTGTTSSSTTLTVSAAILDAAGNTPTLVGAVVTGAGITGTVKVASVTSSTVYELDTAISATASAYIFSPIYGAPDLSGVTQTSGYYYICSEAGSATPNGAGTEPNTWSVGDWVIWNDDVGSGEWQKVDNSSVLSGAGTGQTVALWEGPSSVTDSETLGNAPITVSGNNTTFAGAVVLLDDKKLEFGGGGDFKIWHAAGENTYLRETGEGATVFQSNGWYFQNTASPAVTGMHLTDAGTATFSGNLNVNGNATLGNATTDDHVFNGQVTQVTGDALGFKLLRSNGATSMLISASSDAELEFGTDNGSGTNTTQWTIGKDGTDNSFRISNSASLGTSDTLTLTGANATFAGTIDSGAITTTGNITSTATSFVQSFNVTDNSTFFNINHTGNEAWAFKCESIGGTNDAITIGTTAGTIEVDEAGQIFSHQKLDVATAGGRLTGKSNRGYLASIHLEQVATGADGGEIYFMTAPNGTTAGVKRMVIESSGNVGIGTDDPDSKLDVTGGDITVNTSGVGFMNFKYGSAGSESTMGSIQTTGIDLKINATSDLLLLPGSNVGIGTTGPTGKLEVQRSQVTTQFDRDCFLRLHPSATTDDGGFTNMFFGTSTTNNYGVALGGKREGTGDGEPTFAIRMLDDAIAGIEVLNIGSTGAIKFNAYNSTNNTGTPTYMLGTDASGNVVKVLGGDIPGVPGGSGTLRTIPMWTPDGDTLGNSVLKQDVANQNIGLGITPETGMVTYVAQLRIGEQSAIQGHTDGVGQDSFTCVTTNWKFSTSGAQFINGTTSDPGYANLYQQQVGEHSFLCSTASGIAGGAITSRMQMVIKQTGNVGIGTTSPGTLHSASYGFTRLHIDGGTDRGQMIIEGDSFAGIVLSDNGATANQRVFATSVDDTKYTIKPLNDNGTSTAGGVAVTILHGGDVGVGTTSPTSVFHVSGANSVLTIESTTSGQNCSTWYKADGNNQWETGCNIGAGTDYQIYDRLNSASRMVVGHNGDVTIPGNVGIGTTGPGAKLDISDATIYSIKLSNTAAYDSGINNGIVFNGKYTSGGSVTDMASVRGGKDNTTDGDFGGKLTFHTRTNNGVDTERMRIDSTGNLVLPTATSNIKGGTTAGSLNLLNSDSTAYITVNGSTRLGTPNQISLITTTSIAFYTGSSSTKVMQILSSGNVNIGPTETASSSVTGPFVVTHTSSRFLTSSYEESAVSLSAKNNNNNLETLRLAGDSIKFFNGTNTVGSQTMVILNSGNVGINVTGPSYKLDVGGTIRATGDIIAYSDIRVKENIKTIDNSLEKVSKLRGVEFNKIGDNEKSIGVIAQEIEKVIPEVVKEDDEGMKSVAYGNISGLLIEAIKELKAEIEDLKKKIK